MGEWRTSFLNDHQGNSAGRAVDGKRGDAAAQAPVRGSDVRQGLCVAAPDETLHCAGHAPLRLGYAVRMTNRDSVGPDVPALGVFQQALIKWRMGRIRSGYLGWPIDHYKSSGNPAEEDQGDSGPTMTSCTVSLKLGQTEQCRE